MISVFGVLASLVVGLPYVFHALVGLPDQDTADRSRRKAIYEVTEWSADGKIYYRSVNGILCWLDPAAGIHERISLPPGVQVTALCRSADAKMLAMGLLDGPVLVEHQRAGSDQFIEVLPEGMARGADTITALQFSPDGRWLAAGSDLGLIWIGDMQEGAAERFQFVGHAASVLCLRWLPDGRLISTGRDACCRLWDLERDVEQGRLVREFIGHSQCVFAAAVSHDGRLLVTTGKDASVCAWEMETGRTLWSTDLRVPWVTDVVMHPIGPVACGGTPGNGPIWLLDRQTGRVLRQLPGHDMGVATMQLSPDGGHMITAGYDGRIRVWQTGPDVDAWHVIQSHDGPLL